MLDLSRIPEVWIRIFAWVAAGSCAIATLTHMTTYGTPDLADPVQVFTFALFPLIFLVFGAAILLTALCRVSLGRLFGTLPLHVKVLGVIAVAYIFLDFFWMIHLLPGQPTEQDGRFFFNDHGRLIPISSHAYRQSLLFQARLFSGHEITFSGVATILGYQLDRLRRGELTAPPQ